MPGPARPQARRDRRPRSGHAHAASGRRASPAPASARERQRVGAEALAAGDLGRRVEPRRARADGLAGARRRRVDDRARGDREHRLDDLAVAGAAAQHAGERVADLGLARPRIRAQQRLGAHQHARRADAALRRAVGDEGALQRRQRAVGAGEAFDRRHRAAVALADADDARADLLAVEQHRAGAAVAGVAADLGAGQAELVAQRVGEAPARIAGELARAAVDVDADDAGSPAGRARSSAPPRAHSASRVAGARAHGEATSRRARRTSVAVASRR